MQLSKSETLKLFIWPKADPVIVHSSQTKFTVSGQVGFVCKEYLPFCTIVNIELQVVKTTHCFQMGGESTINHILFQTRFPLQLARILPKTYGRERPIVNPCRAYSKPFDFILDAGLLPTVALPKFSVKYILTANLDYSSIPQSLQQKLPKNVEVKQMVTVIGSSVTKNLVNQATHLQPIIRQGTLRSENPYLNPMPFTIIVDKGVACPGDLVRFHIVVDPPSCSNNSNTANISSDCSSLAISSTQSLIPGRAMPHKRYKRCSLQKPGLAINFQDKKPFNFEQIPELPGILKYKVQIILVQVVTFTNVRSLEAPSAYFKSWEQTICAKETKDLYLSHVMDGIHMDFTISLPAELQCNIQTNSIHVQYKIFVDLFPRLFSGSFFTRIAKAACSWITNRCASSVEIPLLIIPIPSSTLMANPPSYSP